MILTSPNCACPIKRIRMVTNSVTNKPCGYAFVAFEHSSDMHSAYMYKYGNGKKIDGKRVVVGVELGQIVKELAT